MLPVKELRGNLVRGKFHVHPLFGIHLILVPVADKHMGRGIRDICFGAEGLGQHLVVHRQGTTLPAVRPHDFGYELFRKIGLAPGIVEIVGEGFMPVPGIRTKKVFRERQILPGLIAFESVCHNEPLQKRDGRIYTIAIGIIIEVAVKVGPLRKEDRTFYAQGNFAVEHIGHFEICLPVMPAAGFDLHRVQRPAGLLAVGRMQWESAKQNEDADYSFFERHLFHRFISRRVFQS